MLLGSFLPLYLFFWKRSVLSGDQKSFGLREQTEGEDESGSDLWSDDSTLILSATLDSVW